MSFRGRFAPSPTGDLHLGNARTALLAWLQARSKGGHFVMRVEDLDPGRSREEYIASQLEDLRWLGLDWDEGPDVGGAFGPYLQSQRSELYRSALDRLRERGLVFECACSRKEIAAASSAPHADDDEGPVYPGTCLNLSEADRQRRRRRRDCALRFDVADEAITFDDEVAGQQSINPAHQTGAFVVQRKDGVAAYQLAVVVDDASMQITHVLRGADLLSSTARQLLLYRALELDPPRWAHVPLMLGDDGERLSKRNGAVSLRELRELDVDPREVSGWLAATCGLCAFGDKAAPQELIESFSLEKLREACDSAKPPAWSSVSRAAPRSPAPD